MKTGWVYIMTNKPNGTLYIGVTGDLPSRVEQHRTGEGSRYCHRYNLHRLVYCEGHSRMDEAIAREKAMKAWKRQWKVALIEQQNPEWRDLYDDLIGI